MGNRTSINLWHAKRRGSWLVGCGVVLAICVLIIVGLGIYVSMNMRGWAASGMDTAMTAMIENAPIDDAEKAESIAVVDDFVQRFRDKDVTFTQLGQIFEQLTNSPVLPAGVAMGIGQAYFVDSGLSEEEQADGQQQLARIAHGIGGGTLEESDLIDVLQPLKAKATEQQAFVINLSQNTTIRVKNPDVTTDEELRAFIEAVRAKADERELPTEPPEFDLSGELQRLIDAGLAGTSLSDGDGHDADHDGDDHDTGHDDGDHDHDDDGHTHGDTPDGP